MTEPRKFTVEHRPLCGELAPGGCWYCTKERGHTDGEHVASIGPVSQGGAVLARWGAVTPDDAR